MIILQRKAHYKERLIIQTLIDEEKNNAFIAKKHNRARSTISRKINKFVVKKDDKYDATLPNWLVKDDYLSKRNLDKISTHIKLIKLLANQKSQRRKANANTKSGWKIKDIIIP